MHSICSRWKSSGFFPENLVTRQRSKICANKTRSDIKGTWRLSTLAFIFYIRSKRKNERRKEKTVWKAIENKKKRQEGKKWGMAIRTDERDARKTRREKGDPGFLWGLEKYLHTPPTSLPLYRPRDSSISVPASPYSEVLPAEATFDRASFSSLHSIPFPSFSLLLYLCSRAWVSLSSSFSFSLSLFLLVFLLPRRRFLSSRSFLLVDAMCIRKYESFVALSTTAFLELSAIVHEWRGDKGRN